MHLYGIALTLIFMTTVQANCPTLTSELAKTVDLNCEHHDKITAEMHSKFLEEAHETTNICWTTFSSQKLSRLLQIRNISLEGKQAGNYCVYSREDNTTYLYLEIEKD